MKTRIFARYNCGVLAKSLLLLAVTLVMAPHSGRAVGSWKTININSTPFSTTNYPGHMMLLSDGTVMVQNSGAVQWYSLKPDNQGHYLNGTWGTLSKMIDARDYYASQVLTNGSVLVAGGEYGDAAAGHSAEVYNPVANSWTATPLAGVGLSDAESIMLPNGDVMVEPVGFYDGSGAYTFLYNPSANQWSPGPVDLVYQDESTWVKLPDGSVLSVDIWTGGTTSERYIPYANKNLWAVDGNLPLPMEGGSTEVGGAFMLADGRAFWLGGSGYTAFYTPSGNTNMGSWAPGPNMPFYSGTIYGYSSSNTLVGSSYTGLLSAQDTPAAMMNNGKILCNFAPNTDHSEVWFYEYDPSVNNFVAAPCPTNTTPGTPFLPFGQISDVTSMLDLPDGTVLYNDDGYFYIYTPDGSPLAAGRPTITSVTWNSDGSLLLRGTLFNGISQGASFGDDNQQDSNYPLVRYTDGSGKVSYWRTYNWSSTGVQTGSQIVTTQCTVPASVFDSPGPYSIQVVANGNASNPFNLYGPVWVDFNYSGSPQNGNFATPFETLAQGTNAVVSGGTIALNASIQPSHTSATLTIAKPMTIISVNGPSTIGN